MYRGRYALVYSNRDLAGTGIAEHLRGLLDFREYGIVRDAKVFVFEDIFLAGFDEDVLYFDFLDEVFDVEAYIVLSRHRSSARIKSLTVHHTGNPGPRAEAGGNPFELSIAFPPMAKKLLSLVKKYADETKLSEEYDVTLEVTHHGPTSLKKPLVFIEIGSSPEEWVDERARKLIARVVADAVMTPLPDCTPATGFGGGHYARKHTRVMLETEYCLGHIFSKHAMQETNESVILQGFEKSAPPSKAAIIEKKGVRSRERRMIEELATSRGLEIVKI